MDPLRGGMIFCAKSARLAYPRRHVFRIMPKLATFRTNELFNLKTGEVRAWDEASDVLENPLNLPVGFITRVSYPKRHQNAVSIYMLSAADAGLSLAPPGHI